MIGSKTDARLLFVKNLQMMGNRGIESRKLAILTEITSYGQPGEHKQLKNQTTKFERSWPDLGDLFNVGASTMNTRNKDAKLYET